jgi:hypothetical protein
MGAGQTRQQPVVLALRAGFSRMGLEATLGKQLDMRLACPRRGSEPQRRAA